MAVHADVFKRVLGRFPSGVTVVTLGAEDVQLGLTVSAFCSVSLNPPLILVCIHQDSPTLDVLAQTKAFAVNLLAKAQENLSNQFATRREDKFEGVAYRTGRLQVPLLNDTLGWMECTVVQEVPAGDHVIVIGQVEEAHLDDSKEPLVYYHRDYGEFRKLSS